MILLTIIVVLGQDLVLSLLNGDHCCVRVYTLAWCGKEYVGSGVEERRSFDLSTDIAQVPAFPPTVPVHVALHPYGPRSFPSPAPGGAYASSFVHPPFQTDQASAQ